MSKDGKIKPTTLFLRRHMNIPILDMIYRFKWDITKKREILPHWIIKKGNKKKAAIYLHGTNGIVGNGIGQELRYAMHLNEWCKRNNFVLYVYYDPLEAKDDLSESNNLWSQLFEQKYSLDYILSGEFDVIVFTLGLVPLDNTVYELCDNNKWMESEEALNKLFHYGKGIVNPNKEIEESAERYWRSQGLDQKKVLGVFMREEFSLLKYMEKESELYRVYSYHPHMPSPRECLEIVKEKVRLWGMDCVFISTLYVDSIDIFEDAFGRENVFYIDRKRSDYKTAVEDLKKSIESLTKYDKNDMNFRTNNAIIHKQYMEDLLHLSKCDSLCTAISGGVFILGSLKEERFRHMSYFKEE